MESGLLRVETQDGLHFLSAPGPSGSEGENVHPEDSPDVVHREPRDATLQNALEIARAQLERRKRRLGNLTHEQEEAVEELLIQTVRRVSKLAGKILESLPAVP
jgi:hypothetical protein